ncbi:MAG TPA: peptide deformylase [Candidatus Acidoferrales bacterium]|nr:peptide deformylase [Candidatus Acidoferrales bacterium]
MTALRTIRLGNPILRKISTEVPADTIQSKAFQTFLDKLAATCLKEKGVGIAAPQVGKNVRVIVVHVDPNNPRYPDKKPFPLTIVINPKVSKRSQKVKDDWEGDLSVNLRGLVPRPISCVVSGLNRDGKDVTYDLQDDFHARVFQHEIDHLDGIMFLDKVEKKESFSEYAMWKKYWKK